MFFLQILTKKPILPLYIGEIEKLVFVDLYNRSYFDFK